MSTIRSFAWMSSRSDKASSSSADADAHLVSVGLHRDEIATLAIKLSKYTSIYVISTSTEVKRAPSCLQASLRVSNFISHMASG
jgi:hypothetical protein